MIDDDYITKRLKIELESITRRLKNEFESALVQKVEKLFEQAPTFSANWADVPVVGGGIFCKSRPYPSLILDVCNAIVVRDQFRAERPDWPVLPLRQDDCYQMNDSADNRRRLTGYFGNSQHLARWGEEHPGFADFAAGLLAYRYTPWSLRNDASLVEEFPPRELPGICDRWMHWRSPETIASHRRAKFKPRNVPKMELAWSAPVDQ